jgi:hypothetical protein
MFRRHRAHVQHGLAVLYAVAIVRIADPLHERLHARLRVLVTRGARVRIGMKLLMSSWFNNRLPFEKGASATAEYPYAVTSCLSYGALRRAR